MLIAKPINPKYMKKEKVTNDGKSDIKERLLKLVKREPTRLSQFNQPVETKVVLTTAQASKYLDMLSFDEERPFKMWWAQVLFDKFNSGQFIWEDVTIRVARLNGQLYRINGQHTCHLRLRISDDDLLDEPTVTERLWEVGTLTELKALYTADDPLARSHAHLSRVNLIGSPAMRGVPILIQLSASSKEDIAPSHRLSPISTGSWPGRSS